MKVKLQTDFNLFPQVSWRVITLAILMHIFFITFVNLIIFPSDIFDFIHSSTEGLIQVTLLVNIIGLILIIGGIICGLGRLKLGDLGILSSKVSQSVIIVVAFWLLVQIIEGIVNLVVFGQITLNSSWQQKGIPIMLGAVLSQLFGNALYEEAFFRGFLLTQVYLKIKQRGSRGGKSLFLALLITQVFFAIAHIPNRIFMGVPFTDMLLNFPMLLVLGLMFALIYHRTDNLLIAVGIHTLLNTPASIFNGHGFTPLWYLVLTAVLIFFWPYINKSISVKPFENSLAQDR